MKMAFPSSLITVTIVCMVTSNSIQLSTSTSFGNDYNSTSVSAKIRERRIATQQVERPRFEVCYGSLGCFKQEYPFFSFERPVIYPPASPAEIGIIFLLYTRENSDFNQSDTLIAENNQSISDSHFKKNKKVTMIIHGFTSSGDDEWVQILTMELLAKEDMNVIVVSWTEGAEFPYEQATSNTRVVGAQVAQLLNVLIDEWRVPPEDCHLIGHSLGAHIAGYAGERVKNLGRISGLDPASIFFYQNISSLRLDPTDANFVQVIHTNCGNLGAGLCDELGHADFYVNNANFQPGCLSDSDEVYLNCLKHTKEEATMTDPIEPLTCSHHRAIVYYTESINFPCSYWGFECDSYDAFNNGDCWQCAPGKTCNMMGHHVIRNTGRRTYRVRTMSKEPFCDYYYYKVEMFIGSLMRRPPRGEVKVHSQVMNAGLFDAENLLRFHFTSDQKLRAGNVTTSVFIGSQHNLDDMNRVAVTYVRIGGFLTFFTYSYHLDIVKIAVEALNKYAQITRKEFCGEALIPSGARAFQHFSSSDCEIINATIVSEPEFHYKIS